MKAFALAIACGALSLQSLFAAEPIPKLLPQDLPKGCQFIAGVRPLGDHIATLFDYHHYQMVLPPLSSKLAQSVSCAGNTGSILYFAYRSGEDRDQAVLFARPLAKQDGATVPIKEWSFGFAIVAFRQPPELLVESLERRLSGNASARVVPATDPKLSESTGASSSVLPIVVPSPQTPQPPSAPASVSVKIPITAGAPVQTVPLASKTPVLPEFKPPAIPAPTAWPPEEETQPIKIQKTPPILNPPVLAKSVKRRAGAVKPSIPKKGAPVPPPLPPTPSAVGRPPESVSELSIDVVAAVAARMECEKNPTQIQPQTICSALQEFASGIAPEPLRADDIYLGPAYTLDSYGRFVDLHYDVLAGDARPGLASFFAYQSAGSLEDFELGKAADAKKAKAPLPNSATVARMRELAPKKAIPSQPSVAGRSLVLLPGGRRRVYIRKSGDHLVMVGPEGATAEEQKRGTVVIAVLY